MFNIKLLFILFCTQTIIGQSWNQLSDLPSHIRRHHPVTFSSGDFGYLLTGSTSSSTSTKDFYKYDSNTDTWTQLSDFPGAARTLSYAVVSGDFAYIGFGTDDSLFLNDLWEYDIVNDVWSQKTSCPCVGRGHPAFVELNGKIYVGLGSASTGNIGDWWEFDIATNSWAEKADFLGSPRHHPYYFTVGNYMYVGFGHGANIYKDFYRYDPIADAWMQLNDIPGQARVAGTQFNYQDKGYILSGDGENHGPMATGEFWQYSPTTDTWLELTPHSGSSVWAPGNFIINNHVYFMGGQFTTSYNVGLWEFNLGDILNLEEHKNEIISIYPNPVQNVLNIKTLDQIMSMKIYSLQGFLIKETSNTSISLSELPAGLYFAQINVGGNTVTKKFIKS